MVTAVQGGRRERATSDVERPGRVRRRASRPTATPRRSSTAAGGRPPTPSWPRGPTPWPTGSAPSAAWWPCASAPTSARSSALLGVLRGGHVALVVPGRRPGGGGTDPRGPRAGLHPRRDATTTSSSRSAVAGAPTSSTRTWPSCSAPRAPPARRSWSGSRTTTCRATPRPSPTLPRPRARPTGRPLTLPLHYCYGLSVLHSHLAVGRQRAGRRRLGRRPVLLGAGAAARRAPTWPGVPHTFELLDRAGFADMELPSLCATSPRPAAASPPRRSRRYAELGRRQGWDLFVMYGQTEATARMAYLPPELATVVPGRGRPGRSRGLARGSTARTSTASASSSTGARTSCSATRPARPTWRAGRERRTSSAPATSAASTTDGLVDVVGRTSRFAKLFGLRLDLDEIERSLGAGGRRASACPTTRSSPSASWPRPTPTPSPRRCGREVRPAPSAVVAVRLRRAAPARVRQAGPPAVSPMPGRARARPSPSPTAAEPPRSRRDRWCGRCTGRGARVRRGQRPTTRFVGLGGDSLSYVEVAMVLEEHLGSCPTAGTCSPSASSRRWSPRPAADPPRWRPTSGCGPPPSRSWSAPTRASSPSSVAPTCCSRWRATTSPASRSVPPGRAGSARRAWRASPASPCPSCCGSR